MKILTALRSKAALAILIVLGSLAAVVAQPMTASADDVSRTRQTAMKFWTPTLGYATVYPYVAGYPMVNLSFGWADQWGMLDLYGSSKRAFEIKFVVSRSWTDGYSPDGYRTTNLPSSSRPYLDNLLSDNNNGPITPGYGVANANYLVSGVNYDVKFAVRRVAPANVSFGAEVRIHAATNLDDYLTGCSLAIDLCVFDDYTHTALRSREFSVMGDSAVSGARYWWADFLQNPSMENSGSSAPYQFTTASHDIWCSGYARRSNCYADFLGAQYGSYMYQDVPIATQAGDNYTMEASLRCPYGGPSCPIAIYVQGMGGTTETRSVTATLPPDGYWYDCRIDGEHGFTAAQAFTQAHSTLRVSIGNFNPGQWLDVDQVLLGNYTTRITGTQHDPTGRPALGPTCTRGDVW